MLNNNMSNIIKNEKQMRFEENVSIFACRFYEEYKYNKRLARYGLSRA